MKKEDLYESIGALDDELVAAADISVKKRSLGKKVAAVLITLTAGAAAALIAAMPALKAKPLVPENTTTPQISEQVQTEQAGGETAAVPQWKDRTISERFSEFNFSGKTYCTRITALPADKIGREAGTAALSGFDIYTDKNYSENAAVFEIKGISADCALAVRFNSDDAYYAYVNSYYTPATLGEFISALNLSETLTCAGALRTGVNSRGEEEITEYKSVPAEKLIKLLSDNASAALVPEYDDFMFIRDAVSVSVGLSLLGYKNVSLSISDSGYLQTNILDTGKCFFIGEENARAFGEYLETLEKERLEAVSGASDSSAGEEMTSPAYSPE